MTSKNSYSNRFWQRFNQYLWLASLWSAVLFFIFPVTSSLALSVDYVTDQGWRQGFVETLVKGQFGVAAFFSIIIAVLASNTFNYLNSRKALDFYHSQPVTRNELFWQNYLVGWSCFLFPLAAAVVLEMGIIALLPGFQGESFAIILKGILSCCTGFFAVNSVFVLGAMLCGNRFFSLITGGYFCALPALILLFVYHFITRCSFTFDYGKEMGTAFANITPITPFISFIGKLKWWSVIIWLVVPALLVLLSLKLYHVRKSESAGKVMAFPGLTCLVRFPMVVFAGWVGQIMFRAISDSLLWECFGLISFGMLAFFIVGALEKLEFKNAFRGWKRLAVTGGAYVLAVLLIFVGSIAFDKRCVSDEDVVSIDLERLTITDHVVDDYGNVTVESYESYRYLYNIRGEQAIHALNALARSCAENRSGLEGGGSYLVWDDTQSWSAITMNVTVHTKTGSFKRQYYYRSDRVEGLLEYAMQFDTSEGAKKALVESMFNDIDTEVEGFTFRPSTLVRSKTEMERVYNELKKDIENATLSDYSGELVGFIYINTAFPIYDWDPTPYETPVVVPVYSSFKNVMATCKQYVEDYGWEKPTVGSFSSTQTSAEQKQYDVGYSDGYTAGDQDGRADGKEGTPYFIKTIQVDDAYTEGYYDGYRSGYDYGYGLYMDVWEIGYNQGKEDGYEIGFEDGKNANEFIKIQMDCDTIYQHGYLEGLNAGYENGYKEGQNQYESSDKS